MKIKFQHSEAGDVKYSDSGVNWFLFFTAPIFGITLFKNKLNRSAMIMMISSILCLLGVVMFAIFSSAHASYYPYGDTPPSTFMKLYYLLDLDYKDIMEFSISMTALLILFIILFSGYIAVYANRWIAENYKDLGYKVVVPNSLEKNKLKKEWNFDESDFIIEHN